MLRRIFCRCFFAITACVVAPFGFADASAQAVHVVTAGNLQAHASMACINLAGATSSLTPADIYPGVGACASNGDFENAVALYALAGAYGRFDGLRVADQTARDAPRVLQLATFNSLAPAALEKLIGEANRQMKDPARLAQICRSIGRVGKPNYLPAYMIQHGMAAFNGIEGDGLVADFNADAAWKATVDDYLHCPAGSVR